MNFVLAAFLLLFSVSYNEACMKTVQTVTTFTFSSSTQNASVDPAVTAWKMTTGNSAYITTAVADISKVEYNSQFVYAYATGLPSYNIGPWSGNPNKATAHSYKFIIPRVPVVNTGTKTAVSTGLVGTLTNGVPFFNPEDAQSVGSWKRNAYYFEGSGFDNCTGHPQQSGQYHVHGPPVCLFNSADSSRHSPIIGFAFDGFPLYGPFGYSSANNASSAIRRMVSGYSLRSITDRTVLADGTATTLSIYQGPSLATYPLGAFIDDYAYSSLTGDLDVYNGRWCVTPDYPNGTYAYFLATDSSGTPTYPYIIGPYYYGQVVFENFLNKSPPRFTQEISKLILACFSIIFISFQKLM